MSLIALPPEIFVLILASYCDIATLLALGQTCKALRPLSFSKAIWVLHIKRLQQQGLIARREAPDPSELSTEALVDLVKRVVLGPESWRVADGQESFEPHLEVARTTLPAPMPAERAGSDLQRLVTFLPGDDFLLVKGNDVDSLECWDIERARKIWHSKPPRENTRLLMDAVERCASGMFRFAMVYAALDNHRGDWIFEVVQLDIASDSDLDAVQTQLLELDIVGLPQVHWHHTEVQLYGDFGILNLFGTDELFLINWRAKTASRINILRVDYHVHSFNLTANCIILLLGRGIFPPHDSETVFAPICLQIYDPQSVALEPFESPAYFDNFPVQLSSTLSPILQQKITPAEPNGTEFPFALFVYPSPLVDDTFRVWACAYQRRAAFNTADLLLHHFSLALPTRNRTGQSARLEPAPAGPVETTLRTTRNGIIGPNNMHTSITYSGHGQLLRMASGSRGQSIHVLHPHGHQGLIELPELKPEGGGYVFMSPSLSGAWAYAERDEITILRFR
ncbi:hypothetical protein HMN09_00128300 [Mycena chlorophos]|uniref:F-box domain-containing protein n=1 Tax=Mycena chlorophos TaxID=658473 RepID=A0A8H6TQT1_MYCCL|nr:hypothetical protein HMN09_00128300 [Mycena chlorophos]